MATVDLPPGDPDMIDVGPQVAFADVGGPDPDAVVDPHWLDLRTGAMLPMSYMPPAMPGPAPRPPWLRAVAVVLVTIFLAATAAGVCLTYGPPSHW
jgi:hypothetical protein